MNLSISPSKSAADVMIISSVHWSSFSLSHMSWHSCHSIILRWCLYYRISLSIPLHIFFQMRLSFNIFINSQTRTKLALSERDRDSWWEWEKKMLTVDTTYRLQNQIAAILIFFRFLKKLVTFVSIYYLTRRHPSLIILNENLDLEFGNGVYN